MCFLYNVFYLYIYRITPFLFFILPRICVFSYKCFFFLYIGNRHFFFLGSPPESIPIYSKYLFLIYLAPVFPIYILLYFAQIPYIYSYFSIGGFLYIPFLFFVLPRLIAISLYIINFCILPRLIYIVLETSLFFLYILPRI